MLRPVSQQDFTENGMQVVPETLCGRNVRFRELGRIGPTCTLLMAQIAKDAEVLALGRSDSAGRRCRGQAGRTWPALRNCKQVAETGGLLKPGVSVTSFSVRWLRFLAAAFQLQSLPLHVFYVLDEWATLSNMYTKLTFVHLEILAFIRSTKSGIRGRRTDGPTPRHPAFLGHGVNLFGPFKAFLGIDLTAISGESWSTRLFPLGCMTRAFQGIRSRYGSSSSSRGFSTPSHIDSRSLAGP